MKRKSISRDSTFSKWLTRQRENLKEQRATGVTWYEFLFKAGATAVILGFIKLIGIIYFSINNI
jgi:hypothetical protein